MKTEQQECKLCSQTVEVPGFTLETKDGTQYFCCEGCISVYRLLNPKKLLPTTNEKKNESL